MRRRAFLSWAGVGWVISRVPIAFTAFLAACGGKSAVGSQRVGTIAELDQKGVLQVDNPPIAVIRNPANPQALIAVNPTCTHQGCIVAWAAERKLFVCPCHGAAYAADGAIQKEPATKPLAKYEVNVDGQNVMVKLG
jgi:cytochrome b6-f complex iron-sulfur subunit